MAARLLRKAVLQNRQSDTHALESFAKAFAVKTWRVYCMILLTVTEFTFPNNEPKFADPSL